MLVRSALLKHIQRLQVDALNSNEMSAELSVAIRAEPIRERIHEIDSDRLHHRQQQSEAVIELRPAPEWPERLPNELIRRGVNRAFADLVWR